MTNNLTIINNLLFIKLRFNCIVKRYMQQELIRKPSVVSNNKQLDKQSTSESNVQSTPQSSEENTTLSSGIKVDNVTQPILNIPLEKANVSTLHTEQTTEATTTVISTEIEMSNSTQSASMKSNKPIIDNGYDTDEEDYKNIMKEYETANLSNQSSEESTNNSQSNQRENIKLQEENANDLTLDTEQTTSVTTTEHTSRESQESENSNYDEEGNIIENKLNNQSRYENNHYVRNEKHHSSLTEGQLNANDRASAENFRKYTLEESSGLLFMTLSQNVRTWLLLKKPLERIATWYIEKYTL